MLEYHLQGSFLVDVIMISQFNSDIVAALSGPGGAQWLTICREGLGDCVF